MTLLQLAKDARLNSKPEKCGHGSFIRLVLPETILLQSLLGTGGDTGVQLLTLVRLATPAGRSRLLEPEQLESVRNTKAPAWGPASALGSLNTRRRIKLLHDQRLCHESRDRKEREESG